MQISIHAVLLDRDVQVFACFDLVDISIHAVLWDRDGKQVRKEYTGDDISIHAVLWDRDNLYMQDLRRDLYFNPRGPLGPRRGCPFAPFLHHLISIHAVLWDRDSTR